MVVQGEEKNAKKEPKKESPSSPKGTANHKPKGIHNDKAGSTAPLYMYPPARHHALHYYPPYERPAAATTEVKSNSLRVPPGPYTAAQYEMRKAPGAPMPPYPDGSPSSSGIGRDPPPPPHHYHHPVDPSFFREEHNRGPPQRWGDYNHFFDAAGPPPYPSRTSYIGPLPPPLGIKETASSPMGPYRFSDTTLRREALSHLKSDPTPSEDSDAARDGATSPSQIDSSHRDEVTTMGCTCKKTKCLKLYCQCFAVKIYCGTNCRCAGCNNTAEYEKLRQAAIRNILSRNPQAFDTKYKKIVPDKATPEISHKLGCKCRKSACMKKYCECYAGGVRCSDNCRCVGCKNVGRGAPMQPHRTVMLPPLDHGPNLLMAAIAAQPAEKPSIATATASTVRKPEPYMMNTAAQSLAFLKHGSPAPDKSSTVPRRTPSQEGDVGSMPSLGSEESPRDSSKGADETFTFQPNTAEKTAVNALLMAAFAMTEMSGHSAPLESFQPLVSTPPDPRTTMIPEQDEEFQEEECKTPQKNLLRQFQSPKRKQAEASPHQQETPKACGKLRSEYNGESSTESSPSGTGEDSSEDSPKRDLTDITDLTPSVQQKIKRSRIGSVRKGPSRNLGQELVLGHPSPMQMETPKHAKAPASNDLTPVSARCIDFKRMHVGKGTPEPKANSPSATKETGFDATKPLSLVSRNAQ